MKDRDFEKFSRAMLPDFPGFVSKGPMFFKPPVRHALGTIYFDRSGDATWFRMLVIVIPLFVRTKLVYFNFGDEIFAGHWKPGDADQLAELGTRIKRKALPVLGQIDTYEGIVAAAVALRRSGNPIVLEAVACAHLLSGSVDRALRDFDRLIATLAEDRSAGPARDRICQLRELTLANPMMARAQLVRNEAETALALGIAEYR